MMQRYFKFLPVKWLQAQGTGTLVDTGVDFTNLYAQETGSLFERGYGSTFGLE
jgi:hypothetical protein